MHVLKCYETISHVNNAQESPCFHQPWPYQGQLPFNYYALLGTFVMESLCMRVGGKGGEITLKK